MTYKILKSGVQQAYNTAVTYTVPTGKTAVISKAVVHCNASWYNNAAFKMSVVNSADSNAETTLASAVMDSQQMFEMTGGITLSAGDSLKVYCDTNQDGSDFDVTIFGDES